MSYHFDKCAVGIEMKSQKKALQLYALHKMNFIFTFNSLYILKMNIIKYILLDVISCDIYINFILILCEADHKLKY